MVFAGIYPVDTEDYEELRNSMADGTYVFGDENLPFMDLVKNVDDRLLPFKHLFLMVNATHIEGLDIDDDEED